MQILFIDPNCTIRPTEHCGPTEIRPRSGPTIELIA